MTAAPTSLWTDVDDLECTELVLQIEKPDGESERRSARDLWCGRADAAGWVASTPRCGSHRRRGVGRADAAGWVAPTGGGRVDAAVWVAPTPRGGRADAAGW